MTASDNLGGQFDYRGQHQPSLDEEYSPGFHEMDKAYPDYYDHPEYYGTREMPGVGDTARIARSVRGRPGHVVRVYRAAPKEVNQINTGDWVTPSHEYAKEHGEANLNGNYRILSGITYARHLRATGDHPPEFGYAGPPLRVRRFRGKQ
jgi:hypothetical protein